MYIRANECTAYLWRFDEVVDPRTSSPPTITITIVVWGSFIISYLTHDAHTYKPYIVISWNHYIGTDTERNRAGPGTGGPLLFWIYPAPARAQGRIRLFYSWYFSLCSLSFYTVKKKKKTRAPPHQPAPAPFRSSPSPLPNRPVTPLTNTASQNQGIFFKKKQKVKSD